MDVRKIDFYEACDKAIMVMNREILREFGRLKTMKHDEKNIVKNVTQVYRKSKRRAKQRYYGIAYEEYLLVCMAMCNIPAKKAHQMAEKAITDDWVDKVLAETDFVTLYRFDTETERKANRLIETLSVTENWDREIDKAIKEWSRQLGQYAINFTDYASIQALDDAGVEMVEWMTARDERVCHECHALDGQVFRIDEVPRKPHWGCRCHWKAVFREEKA